MTPFRLSRTKIELFLECPRCFYLDRRLGVKRPDGPGFSLNSAVDTLLKKEFDLLRAKGRAHDLMKQYKIAAVPFKHPDLPIWRDDVCHYVGASVLHKKTNFELCGIIDDIWQAKSGALHMVDYKATSTKEAISLNDKYKQGYKKQIEFYQWIFRRMGFTVSDTAYFVFANGSKKPPAFDKKLEFELSIISHEGDDSWVEPTLIAARECLVNDEIPSANWECEHCSYCEKVNHAAFPTAPILK